MIMAAESFWVAGSDRVACWVLSGRYSSYRWLYSSTSILPNFPIHVSFTTVLRHIGQMIGFEWSSSSNSSFSLFHMRITHRKQYAWLHYNFDHFQRFLKVHIKPEWSRSMPCWSDRPGTLERLDRPIKWADHCPSPHPSLNCSIRSSPTFPFFDLTERREKLLWSLFFCVGVFFGVLRRMLSCCLFRLD